jgi:hypothetical protein
MIEIELPQPHQGSCITLTKKSIGYVLSFYVWHAPAIDLNGDRAR